MSSNSKLAYAAALRTELSVFVHQAFVTLYPTKDLQPSWHLEAIVHALDNAIAGKTPRLIVNLPPRHLKSFLISVALPAFMLGNDPTIRIMCVSYTDELSRTIARDFIRVVQSPWYQAIFPGTKFSKTTENEYVTDSGGSRFAVSTSGSLTGRGADVIIVDDPTKPEDVVTEKARQSVNDWFRSTLFTRLDDKKRGLLIVVQQRLHANDLTGFLEAGGGFKKLAFAAIATKDEEIPIGNGRVHIRREGDVLHAEREDLAVLNGIRDQVGSFYFNAQYQQSPDTPDGNIFKRRYFQRIKTAPQLDAGGAIVVSIDTALSTSTSADFSAFSILYLHEGKIYVLEASRGRYDYEELLKKAVMYLQKYGRHYRPMTFLIEAAGIGISLYSALVKRLNGGDTRLRVFRYKPEGAKLVRAMQAVPSFSKGLVRIVDSPDNTWVEQYVNEFVNFPEGRYDDWVDSLVQVVLYEQRLSLRNFYSDTY